MSLANKSAADAFYAGSGTGSNMTLIYTGATN